MERWILANRPDWHARFSGNLRAEEGFYLFDQENSCMFLDSANLCLLHVQGVKPQECFVWPVHVYVGTLGDAQIRVSTTCCEGYKFITAESPSVAACEEYAKRIGHARLARFREVYGGSYGNRFVKEVVLPTTVRTLASNELDRYRRAGEAFFPGEDWERGMHRVSRMHARRTDGLLVYEEGEQIVGYATLWPLSDEAVGRLKAGQLKDCDIDEKCMPDDPSKPVTAWIMTAIAVAEPDRKRRRQIVAGLLYAVHNRVASEDRSEIYAHAATDRGSAFLRRKGFRFDFPKAPTLCVLEVVNS